MSMTSKTENNPKPISMGLYIPDSINQSAIMNNEVKIVFNVVPSKYGFNTERAAFVDYTVSI
jgi:hypothetical protein